MKILISLLLTSLGVGFLSGCSGGGSTTTVPTPTPAPAAAITGVDTPKSVAVVTAN